MTAKVFRGGECLRDKTIFLSASKPSREPELFPVVESAALEIEEAVLALARAVFAEKGRLVFGAHPSITPLVTDVATEYFPPSWDNKRQDPPVVVYQSKAFLDEIPEATRQLGRLGYARIEMTEIQGGEKYDPAPPRREQCLASLAHMRQRMFAETRPVAMVAAGGMQGIVREARLFLDMFPGARVYFLRTSGGASGRLIPFLQENPFHEPPPKAPDLRERVIALEDRYDYKGWENLVRLGVGLPRHPYALLMQRAIREIGL